MQGQVRGGQHALNHWDGFTLFLLDGRVEIYSNTVERSMRPIAMGRRNSSSSGSEGGAESRAILASMGNMAKLYVFDPQACLCDVLQRIVSRRTKGHQLLAFRIRTNCHQRCSPLQGAASQEQVHVADATI
ncbi:IS66 family transposase [Bradyrhizobium sp. USDA 3364]